MGLRVKDSPGVHMQAGAFFLWNMHRYLLQWEYYLITFFPYD